MNYIYITIGFFSLTLGSVGIAVPMLPTTPFFLLAAFCFGKSSKRLSTWFKETSLYKKHLESFNKKEGLTISTKIGTLVSISILFLIGGFFMNEISYGKIMLFTIWLAHVVGFLFFVKTKK